MQVFVPYHGPFHIAEYLDRRRLNKQVIECRQIIKAICGESSAWRNHPVVKMYSEHVVWLTLYAQCLEAYRKGDVRQALSYSCKAVGCTPPFVCAKLCAHHRLRLYQKDPQYYNSECLRNILPEATINENVYIVDGKTLWYRDGKLVRIGTFPEDFYGERTWTCGELKGAF